MTGRTSHDARIHPVILSGGTGSRLWPLSRALFPKQLMPLTSEFTMLQETVRRVTDPNRFAPPLVLCHEEHRFIVAEQLRELSVIPRAIVLEPEGRNTGPAAAVAAMMMAEEDPDRLLLLLPSDHVVGNAKGFLAALHTAMEAASTGSLVAFGIAPERPETGYGYIMQGEPLDEAPGCYRIARFMEKPARDAAARLIAAGDCYWNSGMFLFSAKRYLEELERLEPDIVAACRKAVARGCEDLDFFRLGDEAFRVSPAISIDYAVMEHTDAAAVVPADMKWSDLGSWTTLWEIGEKDADGNVISGDVIVKGTRNSYIRGDGQLVAAIGLEDVIIVVADDAVLAIAKDRAQDVRGLVDELKAAGRPETSVHTTVYRPWGSYRTLQAGERFQVKQITVKPGEKLSLQMHHHRAEHWIVVNGTARITRGDETMLLSENESTYVPIGVAHRIENPGKVPLNLIEVQSGAYLGEDDIVRFEDTYGRTS